MGKKILALFVRSLLKLRYRVSITGLELLKGRGGVLLLPNHPAEVDPIIVTSFVWKYLSVKPLILEKYFYLPYVHGLMRWISAIAMPDLEVDGGGYKRKRVQNALDNVVTALKKKDNVLFYPSGRLMTSSRERLGGNSGAHYVLQQAPEAAVFLLRIRGLYGSSFSKALNSGESPDFFATLLNGVQTVFKNLLFFVPKRTVQIEIVPAPAEFPRNAEVTKLNRWLEHWYNQPVPEEPSLVSYSFWKEELATLSNPIATRSDSLAASPQIVDEILTKLSEESGLAKEEISLDMRLNEDLGLDSLGASELMIWLDDKYETSDLELNDLLTVDAVIGAAAGLMAVEQQVEPEAPPPDEWFDKPSSRHDPKAPQGGTLSAAFLEQISKMDNQVVMADARSGVVKAKRLKLSVLLLAAKLRGLPEKHVGIMLPASVGAALAIFATLLARKIPVLLNWTTGRRNLEHAVTCCELSTVLTSISFLDKVDADLTNVEQLFLFMEDLKFRISLKDKILGWWRSGQSTKQLVRSLGLNDIQPSDPAVILFTSGSEAAPKGVPLSHRNILSNIIGACEAITFTKEDVIFSFLPPFHSFGLTATTILPVLSGCKVVFHPNPNESRKIASGCDRWRASCMVGTPTFLRSILKAAPKSFFGSLRLLVSGAERTPDELFDLVGDINDSAQLIEGYGITECSPIVCANRLGQPRAGVGWPLKDVDLLIVDHENHQPLPDGERGLILIAGPNVFAGYLGSKPDPFITVAGRSWYNSGDLGFIRDGALHISGRLKRFVKIGGEMISLPAVEDCLKQTWPDGDDGPALAVLAQESDEGKRPELILFSKEKISADEANKKLKKAGFANIVKITSSKTIKSLPVLGSGKTDIQSLKAMLNN